MVCHAGTCEASAHQGKAEPGPHAHWECQRYSNTGWSVPITRGTRYASALDCISTAALFFAAETPEARLEFVNLFIGNHHSLLREHAGNAALSVPTVHLLSYLSYVLQPSA